MGLFDMLSPDDQAERERRRAAERAAQDVQRAAAKARRDAEHLGGGLARFQAVEGARKAAATNPKRRWQYKLVCVGQAHAKAASNAWGKSLAFENQLNKLGDEGWELAGVMEDTFVFKREYWPPAAG